MSYHFKVIMPDLNNIGSETGIETEERYCSSVSQNKEKTWQNLEQNNTKKRCTGFLEKMVAKVVNTMVGGTYKE